MNAVLSMITLIMLVFVSIWATQSTDGTGLKITGTSNDRQGFFGTNIALIGIIFLLGPIIIAIVNATKGGGTSGFRDKIYTMFKGVVQLIFNFWFPLMMMYYFIQTGATYWFKLVAGVSISISIAMLCYNLWKIYTNQELLNVWNKTGLQSLLSTWNTFPLMPYLKYVENTTTDLNDVAKRVLIFALLCYVAYLMISVYKFKHQLVPCVSSSFASCFWDPEMKFSGYDSTKQTPYVNALFYALFLHFLRLSTQIPSRRSQDGTAMCALPTSPVLG